MSKLISVNKLKTYLKNKKKSCYVSWVFDLHSGHIDHFMKLKSQREAY